MKRHLVFHVGINPITEEACVRFLKAFSDIGEVHNFNMVREWWMELMFIDLLGKGINEQVRLHLKWHNWSEKKKQVFLVLIFQAAKHAEQQQATDNCYEKNHA